MHNCRNIGNQLFVHIADGKEFKNGRHMAAYLGLVPKQHSSGGKDRLLGTSKRGDRYVRGTARFRWVKAPTSQELTQLAHTIAQRVGRFLERQGLLERDAENSYLASDAVDDEAMNSLLGHSITYRIAVGPQAGRKVFSLQTQPACDEPFDDGVGKVAGFSLHAGVAARADERKKLERLCRYISRPAVSEKRLSLTRGGNVRYQLKTPCRVAGMEPAVEK